MVENVHALTARSGTWQETKEMVQNLNRRLRGWANYFEGGAVTKASLRRVHSLDFQAGFFGSRSPSLSLGEGCRQIRRRPALAPAASKLKLTVDEEKTRICKVPEGEFDFLGLSACTAVCGMRDVITALRLN